MDASVSRRRFLAQGAGGLSSVWVSAHWPALLAAATHARHAAQSAVAAKFEFFGAEEAKEVDAVTSRIIPSDETPGRSEEHTSELQSLTNLVCRLLLEKKKITIKTHHQ